MPRYAIIDDTDPLITYTGNWQILTKPIDPLTPEYNGTVHATNDPNATMSINFWGTVINGYGTLDRPALKGIPSTTWQLDSIDPVNFNQSGTTQLDDHTIVTSHMNVYHSGKFADGQHTLKMKVNEMLPNSQTGEKPMFYFDFFAILAGDPIYVENVLLDNGSQFEYGGSWTTNNATGSYRESLQRTPSDGGVAVVGFHGTEITVYGTLNGTYDPNVTLAYFSINEGPQYAVYLPNITNSAPSTPPNLSNVSLSPTPITLEEPLWHQKIWSTKGLKNIGEFQHTITISIPAQTPGGGSGATPTPTPTPTSTGAGAGVGAPLTNAWLFDYVVYGPSSAVGAPTPVLFTTASPSATVIIINNSGAESRKAGAIAGGVIGGLFFVALLVGVLLWRVRRKRQKTKAERAAKEYSYDQRDQQQRQQGQGQGQQDGNASTPGAGFVAGIATLIPRRKDEKGRYRPEDPPVVREEEGRAAGGGGGARRHQRRRRHEEVAEGEVLDISAPSPSGDTTLAVIAANDHNDNSNNNNTNINKSRVGGLELRIPAGRSATSGDGETSTVMTYSTTLGPLSPNTAASVYDYARPPTGTTGARTRQRETDGGVRLASGDEEEFDDTLPPSYARY